MDFEFQERIVGLAVNVHRGCGLGMIEHAYEHCFSGELTEDGMEHECKAGMPAGVRRRPERPHYRVDLLIKGKMIVEFKGESDLDPEMDMKT